VAPRSKSKSDLASEAWSNIFEFIVATAGHRDAVLERLKLTPGDGRALAALEPGVPKTMRTLAEEWNCDASNATWMVDRLEKRGLVKRQDVPGDRRLKAVALTAKGKQIKGDLTAGMYAPPPELLALSREELEALAAAVSGLPRGQLSPAIGFRQR
jgi:DNA-binding MarR family transcriptional regulator